MLLETRAGEMRVWPHARLACGVLLASGTPPVLPTGSCMAACCPARLPALATCMMF